MDKYNDGYRRYSGDFFYVSASSFKVVGDETDIFPKNTRIRFTQVSSGADVIKYFAVASCSYNSTTNETTVVVVPTSANTVANSAISAPGYSYELTPQGYPAMASDVKIAKVALVAGNANAFAFAWQNPESTKILVHRLMIDLTAAGGTATSVLDAGVVANATSTADTLIDGLDINTTGIFDNISDGGTNGKARAKVDENGGTNDYITGKILTANAASLAGYAYIHYSAA